MYHDSYGYNSTLDSVTAAILAIYLIVLVVMFIFYVISYVFKGIGMYTIAKRQGMDYPWLAFIPFARVFLQGELGGEIPLKNKSIKNPGIWLLALPFIGSAIFFIFYMLLWVVGFASIMAGYGFNYYSGGPGTGAILGMLIVGLIWMVVTIIFSAVLQVLGVLVNYQIFKKFTTRNMAIAHSVLCKAIPLYESICLFAMRNKEYNPGMEPPVRPVYQMPVQPVSPVNEAYEQPGMPMAPTAPEMPQAPERPQCEAAAPAAVPPVSTPPVQEEAPPVIIPPVREEVPPVIVPPVKEEPSEATQGSQTFEEYNSRVENQDNQE